jgi:hypothetical protein
MLVWFTHKQIRYQHCFFYLACQHRPRVFARCSLIVFLTYTIESFFCFHCILPNLLMRRYVDDSDDVSGTVDVEAEGDKTWLRAGWWAG